ncbi:MAG TPA: ComF family protein [Sphingomicrobium sp.]|nr:ComF family protein [Sphingomicrobium sp.]
MPPRCAGCGSIVDQSHTFCADCWTAIEFIRGGCDICGLPLSGTDADHCAACLARPPRIRRSRAAVIYDEITRGLAIRLKYGRKVGLAKTMAHYMSPLLGDLPAGSRLVPVPLHRRRLWQRGFNQAGLLAAELCSRSGLQVEHALVRIKKTPPLKGLSRLQRRRTVAGAFRIRKGTNLQGRTIVLVDDVLTTGSTAESCARALLRAGAGRVEFVSWARVIRPAHLDLET